jgi:hypothetical protein
LHSAIRLERPGQMTAVNAENVCSTNLACGTVSTRFDRDVAMQNAHEPGHVD